MLGQDRLVVCEPQPFDEHAHERGVERERSALEHDGRLHGKALCKASERLLGYGVKRRERQILACRPLVEQGLDVGFGVHAAASRDVVDRRALGGQRVELLHGDFEDGGHLVEERARAARAAAVHAHVDGFELAGAFVRAEEHHLGVLAAQLDGATRLGMQPLHGCGARHHLLDERHAQPFGDAAAARSAHSRLHARVGEARCRFLEGVEDALRLPCAVAGVAGEEHVARFRIDGDRLGRC